MSDGSAAEIAALDATAQAELVSTRQVSATELVDWAIERIEAVDPLLNAVVIPLYDRARTTARNRPAGPFAGVPFAVKDLVAELEGTPFTEGSVFLRGNTSRFTSEVLRRAEAAGLVVVGRTASSEFGMSPACEPVLYGPTRNPWSLDHSTSGSSGGSAAAVAAGLVPMAYGNDLGGSIRYPASACGVFGLKPTRGRVSQGPEYGDVAGGWAAEHALTVSVRDSAALLDVLSGPAVGDPYPAPPVARPFASEVGRDPGRLRIAYGGRTDQGVPGHPDCLAALDDAVVLLGSLGHDCVETELPGLTPEVGEAIGLVFNATTAWILGYWVRRLGREPGPDELEPLTRAFWEAGRAVRAADYLLAQERLQRFAREVGRFFTTYDLWLTPTLSEPPARIGEITSTQDDPLRALRRGGQTVGYSLVVGNITGCPGMSVPLWWNADGLPIGVHVMARFGAEDVLFRLAGQLEAARPWATRRPPVHATTAHLTGP